jgi:RNA polymerase sigma-70 factor (ECF subfamily)
VSEPSQSIEDEADWVRRLRLREPAAEQWYFDAHREGLYRAAVYFLGYRDPDAEDMVQETLLQGLAKLGGFEGRSRLSTWLNQICVYLCYKRLRQRQRMAVGVEADLKADLGLASGSTDALHQLLEAEKSRLLASAISALDAPCREVIERRDRQGQAYAVAAAALKLPIGTFMSRLSRCRERLKEALQRKLA